MKASGGGHHAVRCIAVCGIDAGGGAGARGRRRRRLARRGACRSHQGGGGRARLGGPARGEGGEAGARAVRRRRRGCRRAISLASLDGVEIENVKAFVEAVAKKAAGAEIRLAIQRAGREKRLAVKLGARPAQSAAAKPKAAEDAPIPMLDTGGHMALIKASPSRRTASSSSRPATIRSSASGTGAPGKTVRTIRGQSGPGQRGQDLRHGALARWALARGGGD